MSETDTGTATRAGFAAVIGAPNAGKSTLVNRLAGAKVSIVTPKVQTTRFNVRGVVMAQPAQIILVDTPGIFKPRRRGSRSRCQCRSCADLPQQQGLGGGLFGVLA